MKAIIFHTTQTKNTMQASARIANYLAGVLKCKIIDEWDPKLKPSAYDICIFVNSPTAFADGGAKRFEQLAEFMKLSKKQIMVNNDYILCPPSQTTKFMKPKKWTFWSSCPERHGVNIEKNLYVNWNLLTYDPKPMEPQRLLKCVYWGALRPNRVHYFRDFLDHEKVVISTNSRGIKKFQEVCPKAMIYEKFDPLVSTISRYAATVYLEDDYSHRHYCSPANRFYEALSAGIAIFFEPNAVSTMEKAGFNVKDYVVKNKEELIERMKTSWLTVAKKQMSWRKDYRAELRRQVEDAIAHS